MSEQSPIRIERVGKLYRVYSTYDGGEFIDLEAAGMLALMDYGLLHARELERERDGTSLHHLEKPWLPIQPGEEF